MFTIHAMALPQAGTLPLSTTPTCRTAQTSATSGQTEVTRPLSLPADRLVQREFAVALEDLQAQLTQANAVGGGQGAQPAQDSCVDQSVARDAGGPSGGGDDAQSAQASKLKLLLLHRRSIGPY